MSEVGVSSDSQSGVAIHVEALQVVGQQDTNGANTNGDGNHSAELDSYHDGRTTPTPESESANFLSRNSSFPSTSVPESTSDPAQSQSVTAVASAPAPERNTQLAPRAVVGLGPLQGEEQLKTSLTTNDRIFLLVVAKEVEAFMYKVRSGEMPNIIPSIPVATNSTSALASMSASFIIGTHVSSTFQRMLVYKLAEWYGLKAVHVPDVAMIIGVVGSYDTRGLSLRLADLAPREDAPAPAPKIKIMQRSQQPSSAGSASNSSRPGSVVPEDSTSEAGSSRVKTLEERAEAYAKARQRIYGHIDDPDPEPEPPAPVSTMVNGRQGQTPMDDFETVPRDPAHRGMDGPYSNYSHAGYTQYGYGQGQQAAPMPFGYNQVGNPHSQMNQSIGHPGYVNQNPQTQYNMAGPSYMGPMGPMYGHQAQVPTPQQSHPYAAPGQWVPIQQSQSNYHQMPPNNGIPMQWVPHPHPGGLMQMQTMQHQPMPVIQQGMQYPSYGYPQHQQQGNYGYLAQPTPMRPPPHPHSSASSSISSRSYHSYHDASRPHSRGSTTSNMSATSSVRFGSLYPANQGGGTYRQTRRKHHGNGVNGTRNGTIGEGQSNDSRETREHSPGSASTNGSSHSSRRAGSISLIPPSQHPLPQRPDWAANNIPYHPSPIPLHTRASSQGQGHSNGQEHSPTDFPPLRQDRAGTGTYAEPMQVERAKLRPPNGSGSVAGSGSGNGNGGAWNGNGTVPMGVTSPISEHSIISPRMSVSKAPVAVPTVPMPSTPTSSAKETTSVNPPMNETDAPQANSILPAQIQSLGRDQPKDLKSVKSSVGESTSKSATATIKQEDDFPRRPTPSAPQALYNPSAPAPSQSRPQSTKPVPVLPVVEEMIPGRIPSEVIEAKLAAISLKEGVVIGPPVAKVNRNGKPASYAKIVRRD